MIFRPDLAELVLAGEKTVTRRLMSDNPRSPWYSGRCGFQVGRPYSVQPGRGKPGIGRIRIVQVGLERLTQITHAEARREGFASVPEFVAAWAAINGEWDPFAIVWRVEFKLWRVVFTARQRAFI